MDEPVTQTPTPKAQSLDRTLLDVVVDRIWKFFCSTRAAVVEIAIVAMLVLIGTLRNSSGPAWFADHLPFLEGIVRRWYAWDVFHSFVFVVMLAILGVATFIGGMLNRLPGMWKSIRNPTIRTTHGFLNGTAPAAHITADQPPASLLGSIQQSLKSKKYRVFSEQVGKETHVYADKHAYGQFGTYPFHLALIIVLLGGIVAAQWGFREMAFIIPEGSVRDVGHGTNLSVGLVQFTDTYTQEGAPAEYRSDLVIYENGEEVKRGSITVNNPISYDNATFYQASFGQAVQIRVRDANGNLIFDDSLPLDFQSALNPDAPAARIELLPLNATLVIIAPDSNPPNQPELDTLGVRSGEMFIQLRPAGLPQGQMPPSAIVAQGNSVQLEGATIEFVREKRFTLLQVGYNPGIPLFIIGGLMMVAGLALVFYFPFRRIRAIISPTPTGAVAHMAPLAKRDWAGQRDFETLVEQLRLEDGFTIEERTGKNAGRSGPVSDTTRPSTVGSA
jgi:cytochrome c biogenesis protein